MVNLRLAGLRAASHAGAQRRGDRGALGGGSIVRAAETVTVVLTAIVLFMWAVLAHSTPDERARLHDSMGSSTGIAWR